MVKTFYKGWQAFKFQGQHFLAFTNKDFYDNNVHIYGVGFSNYGSWFSVDSFKKHYAKDGESLCLDQPSEERVQP
jgi:hypothetical protein